MLTKLIRIITVLRFFAAIKPILITHHIFCFQTKRSACKWAKSTNVCVRILRTDSNIPYNIWATHDYRMLLRTDVHTGFEDSLGNVRPTTLPPMCVSAVFLFIK